MDKMNQWILVCLLLYNHGKYSSVKCGITCDPKPPCGCELSDGSANIDLSPMQSHATPMFENVQDEKIKDNYFDVDLCRPFDCGTRKTKICYTLPGGKIGYGIDFSSEYDDTAKVVTFVYTQSNKAMSQEKSTNISNSTTNGFAYNDGLQEYTTRITLHCVPSAPGIGTLTDMDNQFVKFHSTLSSKYACFHKNPPKANGLSIGSILCIVLLVCVVVYIIGGIVINKYVRKLEGKELFPNNTFWSSLPSLVKDGCLFTWAKIRRSDEGYEAI